MDVNASGEVKINVLKLLLSLEIGGAERIVSSMILENKSEQIHYTACCLDSKGTYGRELEANGYPVFLIPRKKQGVDWLLPFKLARLISRENISVIHAHGETPWFYSILASIILLGRVRCINTIHGWDRISLSQKKLWTVLTAMSYKIITVSDKLSETVTGWGSVFRKKTEQIINGVNIESVDRSEKQKKELWGVDPDAKVLGMISRIDALKNHRLVLYGLDKLLKTGYRIQLVIVGDGPPKNYLEHLARKIGVREHVIFTGERSDAISFFSLFDLYVLSSVSEGTSMTLLEAMASHTPVIVSDIKGNKGVIDDGLNGFHFRSEDADDFVNTVRYALDNPDMMEKAALNARKKVERNYSFSRMVSEYEKIYKAAVKK